MNTSTFTHSALAQTIKKDLRALADESLKSAREHVVEPAVHAARKAGKFTQVQLSRQADHAERYVAQQYDRTARWITANPVTSVGIALATGVFLSAFLSHSSKR